ncbi:MAG TPA: hypothetical protein ENN07_02755 [candidate division Zixibacteria bacterium]|nr:hypothetical protein [candidate division Zixibacteria bacterium]
MKRVITFVMLLALCAGAVFAMFVPNQYSYRPEFALGHVMFWPVDEAALAEIEAFAEQFDAEIMKITRVLEIYAMFWKPDIDYNLWDIAVQNGDLRTREMIHRSAEPEVWERVHALEATGLVEWACPNYYRYIQFIPNDPLFVNSTSPTPSNPPNQWDKYHIQCPEAWEIQRGSEDILIAILDSGVDVDHPDLKDNIWINPGEDIAGYGTIDLVYDYDYLDSIDNDGNGFVDDLFGYDFVGGVTGHEADPPPIQEDWNPDIHYWGDDGWGEPDPSVGDGVGGWMGSDVGVSHGTHCAGIAAATMNNAIMFAGVAGGGAKIVPVRVANPEGQMTDAAIAAGLEYATIVGSHVISMSLGGLGGSSPTIDSGLAYAHEGGAVLVAASGNMAPLFSAVAYPASDARVIAVGSGTRAGQKASFSQFGAELDLVAPGGESSLFGGATETIWSTWVVSVFEANSDPSLSPADHIYMSAEGTSMACPQVAGVAGLILSQNPSLSSTDVRNILNASATDIGDPGFDNQTGHGMVNAHQAVLMTNIAERASRPSEIEISAFPNPFNATCKIVASGTVAIYDIAGRRVRELGYIDNSTIWDGADDAGAELPTGVYLIKAEHGGQTAHKAITLLK